MHIPNQAQSHEATQPDAAPDKAFTSLQAQLALAGVELHKVEIEQGRQGFVLHMHGAARTLESLPQVTAYAKVLGITVQE